jgi:FtsH-binding integral membrane protein
MFSRQSIFQLGGFALLVGVAAVVFHVVPTVSVAGTPVRTALLVASLGGLLALWVAVGEYRGGRPRTALWYGSFGVGIPLSLVEGAILPWVGVFLLAVGLAVVWDVDRRLGRRLASDR